MSVQSIATQPAVGASVATGSLALASGAGTAPAVVVPKSIASAVSVPQGADKPGDVAVAQAVDKLNEFAAAVAPGLEFSMDKSTHMQIVKLIDNQTNQVIMQFPSQDALSVARAIDRFTKQGALLKERA